MALKRRFKANVKKVSILDAPEFKETTEEVPHAPHRIRVRTFGEGLRWHTVVIPEDKTFADGRSDKFHNREALINTLKAAQGFRYAVAWAREIEGYTPKTPGRGVAKCAVCGARHNRAVFYLNANGTKYIGHSGVDCFAEIVRQLDIPDADRHAEWADAESKRIDKYRNIMAKINDFKRDFPGLYEHREWLRRRDNPYSQLWWEILHQIVSSARQGITEEWLEKTQNGLLDRSYTRRMRTYEDKSARRIVPWLQHVGKKAIENGGSLTLQELRDACYELAYTEDEGSKFYRRNPADDSAPELNPVTAIARRGQASKKTQPKTQPVATPPMPSNGPTVSDKARQVSKKYPWSDVAKKASRGASLTKREQEFIERSFDRITA